MITLYLASGNEHKRQEIEAMLAGLPVALHSAQAFGGMPEVDENAETLQGNASLKANALFRKADSKHWVLADDSGLFVEALGGAPGVRSARYAGVKATDAANCHKLLEALGDIPLVARRAAFRCCFCLKSPDRERFFEGACKGIIISEARGLTGFGYDPIFIPDGYERTFAEMSPEEKNRLSHRAVAAGKLKAWLAEIFQQ